MNISYHEFGATGVKNKKIKKFGSRGCPTRDRVHYCMETVLLHLASRRYVHVYQPFKEKI